MPDIIEKIYKLSPQISENFFYGFQEEHILLIEQNFNSRIIPRGKEIKIIGDEVEVNTIVEILSDLENAYIKNQQLTSQDYITAIQIHKNNSVEKNDTRSSSVGASEHIIQTFLKTIKPKSKNQQDFVNAVTKNDLVFTIGPAGTGKTYLAVALAVNFLKNGLIKKIVLSRPAVEAGESLGFLPGDFKEKIDPYLKPLYDALGEMIPRDVLKKYFDYETIEILPLAYMRGRTINNSFVILDEAQNSTFMQMKMFLTRLGLNSKAIITGDITQIDLDNSKQSGLISSIDVLKNVNKIKFVRMSDKDVVRHPLVKDIIEAYDRFDNKN